MNQNRRLCLTLRIASGVAACSLGVFLAAGAPVQVLAASPQFAYSTEKWASLQDDKLEFDEIADRIHEYNSTVEKNRIEYKDYQGKDSNEIAQEYYDAADEIESSIEYPDSDDAIMVPHWQQHREARLPRPRCASRAIITSMMRMLRRGGIRRPRNRWYSRRRT